MPYWNTRAVTCTPHWHTDLYTDSPSQWDTFHVYSSGHAYWKWTLHSGIKFFFFLIKRKSFFYESSTCLFSDCYCLVTDSKSHGLTLFWSSNASVFCNQWRCDSVSVCFSCFSSTKTCGLQSCRVRTSWNGHLGGLSFALTNLQLDLSEPNCNSSRQSAFWKTGSLQTFVCLSLKPNSFMMLSYCHTVFIDKFSLD